MEAIPEELSHFDRSPLRPLESVYHPEDYAAHWYQRSKLLSATVDLIGRPWSRTREEVYRPDSPAFQLTLAILDELYASDQGHFSAAGNRLVAESIADSVMATERASGATSR